MWLLTLLLRVDNPGRCNPEVEQITFVKNYIKLISFEHA